jgi:hypothetical protein
MGLLTFSINLTLDGCVDHKEGIADDETHAFFTRLMDEGRAMLWGRVTYEMMESYWPAVARGDVEAPRSVSGYGCRSRGSRSRPSTPAATCTSTARSSRSSSTRAPRREPHLVPY